MKTVGILAILAMLVLTTLIAQDATLQFEVASVRPSPKDTPRGRGVVRGGPGTTSPGLLTYQRATLQQLLMAAYGVTRDQIKGPDWLTAAAVDGGAIYNISAKVPPGATKEQVATMLQHLLKERFKLTLHQETLPSAGLAIVVAKNGPKLNKSAGPLRKSEQAGAGERGAVNLTLEKDGFPNLFPGSNIGGTFKDGTVRMRFRDYPMSDLVRQLSFMLGVRIIDDTRLSGKYDFTLKFDPPEGNNMVGLSATLPVAADRRASLNRAGPNPGQQDSVPIISSAMEKQLGLKLQASKVPVDMLVIDHAERTPTDD